MAGALTRMIGRSGAAGVASIVRAARASYVNNAASIVYTLPTGSRAGDLCVIDCSHYWVTTCPSGWVPLIDLQGSNYEAMTFFKVLTSGDIATGSVTINFSNAGYGTVVGTTFIGNYGIRNFVAAVNAFNASTRALTTDSTPATGDNMLLFASVRGNPVISSGDLSSDVVSDYQANSSALLRQGTASGAGALTVTTAYSSTGWPGDHQALIGLSPVNGSTDYANSGGTGNRSSLIAVTATSLSAGASTPQDTVDGSLANSYWWNPATGNGTSWLTFDFSAIGSSIVDQLRLFQDVVAGHGIWRWEGWTGSSYIQCGLDFPLNGGPAPLPIIVPNTAAYISYRLRHMSGSRSSGPYIREFQFRIG